MYINHLCLAARVPVLVRAGPLCLRTSVLNNNEEAITVRPLARARIVAVFGSKEMLWPRSPCNSPPGAFFLINLYKFIFHFVGSAAEFDAARNDAHTWLARSPPATLPRAWGGSGQDAASTTRGIDRHANLHRRHAPRRLCCTHLQRAGAALHVSSDRQSMKRTLCSLLVGTGWMVAFCLVSVKHKMRTPDLELSVCVRSPILHWMSTVDADAQQQPRLAAWTERGYPLSFSLALDLQTETNCSQMNAKEAKLKATARDVPPETGSVSGKGLSFKIPARTSVDLGQCCTVAGDV